MARKQTPKPTGSELAILRVLWQRGPSTVRNVKDTLSVDKPTGYTTVLKLMQIMHEKGLLERDESRRPHIYRPQAPVERTQSQLLKDFVERVFAGSTQQLVLQALGTKNASPEELAEIRALLDEIEGNKS
ncbi:MAG: BlaI/MecI/CopY family transcriptional regulator [Planctomycetes bacterium]|nr:BlaI/MecI/CopY family transcriptional regulator [Planctomycetota bacterium]